MRRSKSVPATAGELRQAILDRYTETAAACGARVLAFSDSQVSPIAKLAGCLLPVRETDVRSFRTLSVPLCRASRRT
jgi:DNA-binding MurR/RpiR family transcriptional regulator